MKKSMLDILNAVCAYYQITPSDLFSICRKREIVEKRMMFVYLCYCEIPFFTLAQMQDFIYFYRAEVMSHAALIHSRNAMSTHKDYDVRLRMDIAQIRKLISVDLPIVAKDFDLLSLCNKYSLTVLSV